MLFDVSTIQTDRYHEIGEHRLEAKTRALAGRKGYTTNLTGTPATFITETCHRLWRIEKAFRISKHDLATRPIYHRTRESIDAHLTITFAAMAIGHYIEFSNWLEHQEIRADRTPLPHRHHRRRRPITDRRRPHHRTRQDPHVMHTNLIKVGSPTGPGLPTDTTLTTL